MGSRITVDQDLGISFYTLELVLDLIPTKRIDPYPRIEAITFDDAQMEFAATSHRPRRA